MNISLSRFFIFIGLALLAVGGIFFLLERKVLSLGNLPGDIKFEGSQGTCVIALGSSLLISLVLTLLLNIIARWLSK